MRALFLLLISQFVNLISFSQCDIPIPYKLGSIDPKFGLSQSTITSDLKTSADVWSHSFGKPLFVNSPSATLVINFVYDQRSALSSDIHTIQNQLDTKLPSLEKQITAYVTDVSVFEAKLAAFNTKVEQINQSGGASPEVYNDLINQQKDLHTQGNSLNTRARQLNLSTNNFNTQVKKLNQNVDQFNQALTQKPEEGLYDANNNIITIYFVNERDELLHTLSHEFGHALGLNHTSDPQSIMYPYSNPIQNVSSQDKQQLDFVCRQQIYPVYWWQQLSLRFRFLLDSVLKITPNSLGS